MGISREDAWIQFAQWTKTPSLITHGKMVETVMKAAAHKYGNGAVDEEKWGIAGLLHDADYDQWPEEHPHKIVAWLKEKNEHEIAHAIAAHYTKWNVSYETQLDKSLLACDELTGFIGACCHIRPGGIKTLSPDSVIKRLKTKSFAANVERDEVQTGIDLLGVDTETHIQFIIDTLKPHAEEFHLLGKII